MFGDILDVGDIDILVCGPGTVIDGADLFLFAHAGTDRDAIGAGVVLGGVVAGLGAVGLADLEPRDVEQVALALDVAAHGQGHVHVIAFLLQPGLDAGVRGGHGRCFRTAGIGSQFHVVGLRADERDALQGSRIERQGAVLVLQQDRGPDGDLGRQGPIRRRAHTARLILRIRHHLIRIELAGAHPDGEHVDEGPVDQFHRQDTLLVGTDGETLVDAAAVGVHAGGEAGYGGLLAGFDIIVPVPDVLDGGAVAGHVTLHTVGTTGQRVQVEGAGGRRHVIDSVIGGHDRRKLLILDQTLVRIQVELAHVAAVHVGAAHVTVELAVVGEIVLGRRDRFHVLRVGAHHAPDEAAGHFGGQERVLAVGFARASPAGVADRLHDRRPEGQALRTGGVDGARLFGDGRSHPFRHRGIPGGTDGHAVGERSRSQQSCGRVRAGKDAVQRLAPDIVVLQPEPGNGRHVVAQQALFLLEREA